MAVYRQIQITYWQDKYVLKLTPEKKFFFMYLLTNSKTKQCGIYECPIKIMSFETGYDSETIKKLLKDFELDGKIKYDYDTEEIGVRNWRKYNETTSPKTQSCIRKELLDVKSNELMEFLEYEKPHGTTKYSSNYRVSEKTKLMVFDKYENKCQKCSSKEDLTIDHIYPRTLGGLSDLKNLRVLCRSCNSKRPLLGEDLKNEIISSGFNYTELENAYGYPIGGGSQKEKEEEKEEEQEEKETREHILSQKQKDFESEVMVYKTEYPKDMLKAFWEYWSEPNKSKTKMRKELEKTWDIPRRLATWSRNQDKFNNKTVKTKRDDYVENPLITQLRNLPK